MKFVLFLFEVLLVVSIIVHFLNSFSSVEGEIMWTVKKSERFLNITLFVKLF